MFQAKIELQKEAAIHTKGIRRSHTMKTHAFVLINASTPDEAIEMIRKDRIVDAICATLNIGEGWTSSVTFTPVLAAGSWVMMTGEIIPQIGGR